MRQAAVATQPGLGRIGRDLSDGRHLQPDGARQVHLLPVLAMTHRRYVFACMAAGLFAGAFIAMFNWTIDPAGVFGHSPGGIYVFNERQYKMVQIFSLMIATSGTPF